MILLHELEDTPEIEQEYKIFVDLDGVLADFAGGAASMVPGFTEEKARTDKKMKSLMWNTIRSYQNDGGKFWGDLNKMPDADQLWNYVKQYNPEILTATGDPKFGAAEQKHEWFPKQFGAGTKINIVRMSKEKAQWAAPNHILIDDMPKSINPWIEAGGIGILHTSAANTISELKKLGL